MTKKIYRIEDKEGKGPYQSNIQGEFVKYLSNHSNLNGRPGIYYDFNIEISDDYFFGFDTMQKLFFWFGGVIKLFYKSSIFRIVIYEIEESEIIYSRSGKQVAFIKP